MDIAASEFFKEGKYDLDFKNPETKEADWIDSDALLEMYKVEPTKALQTCNDNSLVRASSRTPLLSPLRILLTKMTGLDMPS